MGHPSFLAAMMAWQFIDVLPTLNAQNLLYLQSELINLEDELKRLVLADSNSENEQRRKFKSDITKLKAASANEI